MTEQKKKIRVGLIYAGRSGEHEVLLASANAVQANLDPEKYEVVPIGITKTGSWLLGAEPRQLQATEQQMHAASDIIPTAQTTAVTMTGDPSVRRLIPIQNGPDLGSQGVLDVIFPVLHGTYGEDGSLQGLLDMANVPYVGCGVLGAALGMDKEKMKMIFESAGLPNVAYLVFRRNEWERAPESILARIEQHLHYPMFIKPVNLGSSVGINKAHNRQELTHAINVAAEFDHKIIVEQGIDCREFELAVLGNDEPLASVVGEIVASNEFYDY
ncbi:MAG: D-alanine--D-alanine ligase family protein, partial [Ktedonobacteraceae bacterium]